MVLPLRIDRTGGTGKVQEFNPTSEVLDVEVLPSQLPNDWSEFADGFSFAEGSQVWYQGSLYTCIFTHNKTTTTPDATGNWQLVGPGITAVSGSAGQDTITNFNRLEVRLNISSALSGSSIGLQSNASETLAEYVLNLDPDDFASQGGGVTSGGFGLNVPTTPGTRMELDYNDPEMIFLLSKQTSDKTFIRSNGVLTTIEFDLPPADGLPTSGTNPVVPYQQSFNRNGSGVLESIVISLVNADLSLTEVARKTFNRNSDGSLRNIVIS